MRRIKDDAGQATIELMVVLPAALALALVVVNALMFFSDCAAFDRIARHAVRIYATSPGFGEDPSNVGGAIEATVESQMNGPHVEISVHSLGGYPYRTYAATLSYAPTLFGLPMRSHFFGVSMPRLEHRIELTVDPYKPGMWF